MVIVDTPAVSSVSDGLLVATHMDGDLVVVAKHTDDASARKSIAQMASLRIENILGHRREQRRRARQRVRRLLLPGAEATDRRAAGMTSVASSSRRTTRGRLRAHAWSRSASTSRCTAAAATSSTTSSSTTAAARDLRGGAHIRAPAPRRPRRSAPAEPGSRGCAPYRLRTRGDRRRGRAGRGSELFAGDRHGADRSAGARGRRPRAGLAVRMRGGVVANVPPAAPYLEPESKPAPLARRLGPDATNLTCMVRAYRVPALQAAWTFTSDGMTPSQRCCCPRCARRSGSSKFPRRLQWSEERRDGRRAHPSLATRVRKSGRDGASRVPSPADAMACLPGLFPGLLPLVVAVLLLLLV